MEEFRSLYLDMQIQWIWSDGWLLFNNRDKGFKLFVEKEFLKKPELLDFLYD